MKRLIADIEDELHTLLKVKAVKENISIKDILINLISGYVKEVKKW